MSDPQNLGSFIAENKNLVKEYLETRLEIYRDLSVAFAWVSIPAFWRVDAGLLVCGYVPQLRKGLRVGRPADPRSLRADCGISAGIVR
jgi:hypothetical protein